METALAVIWKKRALIVLCHDIVENKRCYSISSYPTGVGGNSKGFTLWLLRRTQDRLSSNFSRVVPGHTAEAGARLYPHRRVLEHDQRYDLENPGRYPATLVGTGVIWDEPVLKQTVIPAQV